MARRQGKKESSNDNNNNSDGDAVGINWKVAEPYAYIGKQKWQLKEGGLSQSRVESLLKLASETTEYNKQPHTELEIYKFKNQQAKKVLDSTLVKFSWIKSAEDPEIGPALLFELAGEIKDFLIHGGKLGRQRLQTRLNLTRQISSNISRSARR